MKGLDTIRGKQGGGGGGGGGGTGEGSGEGHDERGADGGLTQC